MSDEAAAPCSSSSLLAVDPDEPLPQPPPLVLVATMEEVLGPDLIAGTPGNSVAFQSTLVTPPTHPSAGRLRLSPGTLGESIHTPTLES